MEHKEFYYWPDVPYDRLGYRGLLSLFWIIWKMNSAAKRSGLKTQLKITLPV